jgi:DNA-binding MurR/RpiR family transcriptional regulator
MLPEPTVKELVQRAMGTLTPAERKVGRALIAAYPIAGLETVVQLAARARVSVATVMRFVAKLGFDGYPQFQRRLREEVHDRIASPLALYEQRPAARDESDVLALGRRVFGDAIETTYANLPPAEFLAVVDLLADERRRVGCTGGRLSQILAYYLVAHLQVLRTDAHLLGGSWLPRLDELVDFDRNDVVLVFDYRRYQVDTIDLARRVKGRGARIVLFTDPWLSPIAEFADHVLSTSVDAPSPFDSLVAGLAIVETLIAALSSRLADRARPRMERLERLREGFVVADPALPETGSSPKR